MRPFLRRNGEILYKKENQYFTIYLIPPESFNEEDAKTVIRITKGCEIESSKGELQYFKIPSDVIIENKVSYPAEYLFQSDDGKFVELRFGGVGKTNAYAYDCYLVAGEKMQLEAIKIEIH